MFCDQCEEEFNSAYLDPCAMCGGTYCRNCMINHEMCEDIDRGEEIEEEMAAAATEEEND